MGDKGSVPEAPDYGPIAKVAKKASKRSFKLSKKQFKWAKKQQKKNNAVNKDTLGYMKSIMDEQLANAREDRERYEDVFLPLQDDYIERTGDFRDNVDDFRDKISSFDADVQRLKQEATDYGSEANKEFMMGRAVGAVGNSFDAARNNSLKTLEAYGINPSSTRYQALDIGVRTAEAAAKAAAGTNMGLDVDETARDMYQTAMDRELQSRGLDATALGFDQAGQAMDAGMINIGQGFPGQIAGQYGQVADAGNSSVNNQLNTSQVNRGNRVSMNDFLASMNQSLGSWTDALNTGFNNQVDAFTAQQQSSSGVGSLLGTIMGGVTSFFEEGGEVTPEMSPTGGAVPDDVPARVTVGEFVIPEDVVRYYGVKHLKNMITKAEADMGIPEE